MDKEKRGEWLDKERRGEWLDKERRGEWVDKERRGEWVDNYKGQNSYNCCGKVVEGKIGCKVTNEL